MVRGISRRVVVVDSPDPELFEQAIFIVRNDAANRVSAQQLVSEACRVAKSSAQDDGHRPLLRRGAAWLWCIGAAGAAALTALLYALV